MNVIEETNPKLIYEQIDNYFMKSYDHNLVEEIYLQ